MEYKYINSDYLDSVSGGDPEIINEIVSMFKEQSNEIYNEMVSFLAENNYLSLGLLAHKAKSSVAIMGMESLALMLKSFELQAKDGKNPELYESYLYRFKTETSEAVIELEELVRTRKNNC